MRENAEKALLIKPKCDVVTTMKYHFFVLTLLVFILAGWWWSTLLVAILSYATKKTQAFSYS